MITISALVLAASSAVYAEKPKAVSAEKLRGVKVVDMGKLYSEYNKAKEAQDSFAASIEQAQKQMMAIQQEGLALGQELEELQAKANNKTFTEEARAKFREEAENKGREIQQKYMELNSYKQQTDQAISQRQQSVVELHLKEIKEAVKKVALKQGATLVLNSTSSVLYSDDSYDITKEALSILNANSGKTK
ncbi:MAG: OmpH family outer membrane protein [Bdellovibrionota bacterium]